MNLETEIGNGISTFFAGVSLTLADRLFSKNAKRFREERVKNKLAQVEAMDYMVRAEQSGNRDEAVLSADYNNAIIKTREYFDDHGPYKNIDLIRRFAGKIRYSQSPEIINNLSSSQKIAVAYGIEFVYDAVVLGFQTIGGIGHFGKAFGRTLYQGLALFCGMQAGKVVLYTTDWATKTKEEKDLDSIAKTLTKDGKLLQIVRNYAPTAKLKVVEAKVIEKELQELPAKTTDYSLGERVGTTLSDTAEGIGKNVRVGIDVIRQRLEQRRKAQAEAESKTKSELRKPYENY